MMLREGSHLTGNARFKGFCIDLLEEIAEVIGFEYRLKLVDDGNYGAPVGPDGEWNGMVRELMDRVCWKFCHESKKMILRIMLETV